MTDRWRLNNQDPMFGNVKRNSNSSTDQNDRPLLSPRPSLLDPNQSSNSPKSGRSSPVAFRKESSDTMVSQSQNKGGQTEKSIVTRPKKTYLNVVSNRQEDKRQSVESERSPDEIGAKEKGKGKDDETGTGFPEFVEVEDEAKQTKTDDVSSEDESSSTSDEEVSVLVEREELCNKDLVTTISAGMVLKGRICDEDFSEFSLSSRPLLKFKSDQIELLSSQIPEEMRDITLYDEESSVQFENKMKNFGMSAALKFRYEMVGAGTGVNFGKNKKSMTTEIENNQVSKVYRVLNVPTAAFLINDLNITLTDAALHALNNLEKLLQTSAMFIENCLAFFESFGSHYYIGLYHFGGRYEWVATCESTESKSKHEIEEMAKIALKGSLSAGMGWVSGKVRAAVDRTKTKGRIEELTSTNYKISKRLMKHGGPQETDNHIQWKEGLVRYNKTWHVIDMDTTKNSFFIGVWDLVRKTEKLQYRDRLSNDMEGVWLINNQGNQKAFI